MAFSRLFTVSGLSFVIAIVIHGGTALLRLSTFFPLPRLLDFAIFCAGAEALKRGISPYRISADFAHDFFLRSGFDVGPDAILSPPLWFFFLQPFTLVSFPTASWIWLAILIILTIVSTGMLMSVAGMGTTPVKSAAVFLLIVTFGPVFLNLTLGQNGLFLLLAALLTGRLLRPEKSAHPFGAVSSWLVAFSTKVFPVIWISPLPFLRRWKLFFLSLACLVAANLAIHALYPAASHDYWARLFFHQSSSYIGFSDMDDQSLLAAVDRVSRPQTFNVAGLSVHRFHNVRWSPPYTLSVAAVFGIAAFLCLALGVFYLILLVRLKKDREEEILFYLFVLLSLAAVPHMERYNHVLALPALAWLWRQAGGYRTVVCITYLLFGLSRLNHLWALTLPFPLAAFAVSSGLGAVVLTGGAVVHRLTKKLTWRPAPEEGPLL